MKLVEFLIMENLPLNGSYLRIEELKKNVMSDFFSIKKQAKPDIFEIALEKLDSKQCVFINKGTKSIAATQYGINKFSQS
ncbi:MAG: hypothetical protein CMB77_03620 [Euryarchaeota archaeon]|nr:hypothetical protein [Euryarchaeota archaeon]|tara:strand:- start:21276 stop:21515 length:240 start_codon:yes stop_codon:yes gene_type:complete